MFFILPPPSPLPDLYPLLITSFCCFHYIGFLFVDPKYRGKSLGSEWLTALKYQFPDQSYWLTIEDEGLRSFYENNGFKCVSKSKDKDNPEWIFTFTPRGVVNNWQ